MIDRFIGEYYFLSNFFPTDVKYSWDCDDSIIYRSAEHAYQAQKTENVHEKIFIRNAISAREAKKRGRNVVCRSDWDLIKLDVMRGVVKAKFSQNLDLSERLVNTYPIVLVEGNWWGDTFWGMCNKRGENHLGKILMEVRNEIMGISPVKEHPKEYLFIDNMFYI